VVAQQPAAFLHLEVQRLRVAGVVAIDEVQRQPVRERGLYGLRADQVAAVNHGLAPCAFASCTAWASASARSWLSETMQIFTCAS